MNMPKKKREPVLCAIEVQHASDVNRDGVWHTIDTGRDAEWLVFRLEDVTKGYAGRPVRMRIVGSAEA